MPMGAISAVSFTVANSLVAISAVDFQVINAAREADEVDFTVSRATVQAWEAPVLYFRHRIKVGGTFVPERDLVGALEIDDPAIDSHTGGWSFGVAGKAWSLTRTQQVFSRGTEVEVYLQHGPEGAVIEPATPDYSGFVIGCDQSSQHMPIVRIRCADAAGLFEKYETCEEVEPFAQLTRMGITELLGGGAGITNFEGPAGAVYDKPVQAISKRLFETLKALWEPEGCRVYMRGFDTLVVDRPRIKLAPEPPDFVWRKGGLEVGGLKAIPPEDCPSRWIVRGTTAVVVDEVGVSTEMTEQVVSDIYAPKVAINIQNALTGALTATDLSPETPSLRPVRMLQVSIRRRGGKVIGQSEREFGWKNLKVAHQVTDTGGAGTAGGGFDYRPVYQDEDGEWVVWTREKFIVVGERETTNTYTAGNLTSAVIDSQKWYRKTRGVRVVGDSASVTTIANSYVYGDSQSYADSVELYGLAEQQRLTYTYATPEPGPLVQTLQETYRYERIRSRVDGAASATYRICYDGKGQFNEDTASWRLAERKTVDNFLNGDHMVTGTNETLSMYAAPEKADGTYDWGGGLRSNAQFQTFQLVHNEPTQYIVVNEGQVEQVTYPATGGRVPRLILGSLPTTLYQSSAWTSIQMQPFEELLDDATALEWFGFQREAVQHEFCQTAAEAQNVITARRRRRLCPKFEVTRPDHLAKVGDTIQLVSPDDGINARCIVARKSRRWGTPMPSAVYRLEEWTANVA